MPGTQITKKREGDAADVRGQPSAKRMKHTTPVGSSSKQKPGICHYTIVIYSMLIN
jgi:hypothetical protein